MKYMSLFSGIGGFELGIEQAYEILHNQSKDEGLHAKGDIGSADSVNVERATCIGYSEIDKYAEQIYRRHYPTHKNYGDITKINTDDIPDIDLLVGGFPCQAFSIAGQRKGFDDTRGTLFFEIARILKAKQPRQFLLENVKGLLNHDGGKTFSTIITTLDELGYDLEWQVLNSKNHGVPQSRERVFISGHLRGEGRHKVFPIFGTDSQDIKVSCILDTETWRKRHEQIRRVHDPEGISPTLPTGTGGGVMTKIEVKAVLTPDRAEKGQNGRRIKEEGEPSFTLTGQDRHGVFDGVHIRRLTPKECERLQGFPDGWTEDGWWIDTDSKGMPYTRLAKISDTQRYKVCGNAVTVNVIRDIMLKLLPHSPTS